MPRADFLDSGGDFRCGQCRRRLASRNGDDHRTSAFKLHFEGFRLDLNATAGQAKPDVGARVQVCGLSNSLGYDQSASSIDHGHGTEDTTARATIQANSGAREAGSERLGEPETT